MSKSRNQDGQSPPPNGEVAVDDAGARDVGDSADHCHPQFRPFNARLVRRIDPAVGADHVLDARLQAQVEATLDKKIGELESLVSQSLFNIFGLNLSPSAAYSALDDAFASSRRDTIKSIERLCADDAVQVGKYVDMYSHSCDHMHRFISYVIDRLAGRDFRKNPPTTVQKLEQMLAYARDFGDDGLEQLTATLFPEWSFSKFVAALPVQKEGEPALALPTEVAHETPPWPAEAPVKWRDRRQVVPPSDVPGEELFSFVRAVYGDWLSDISKRALRKIDPALINELNSFTRNGGEIPADICISTLREENDRLLGQLDRGEMGIDQHLGKFTAKEAARELQRLAAAKERRS